MTWITSRRPKEEGAVAVTDAHSPAADADPSGEEPYLDLVPMLRRVVGARVKDPETVDDLVQETLARVLDARSRVEPDRLAPYAAVTARNLVASMAKRSHRDRDRAHLLLEPTEAEPPLTDLVRREEQSVLASALAKLPAGDRDLLLAHEVEGQDTSTMAAHRGSTPGAVAARLSRARANLRIEYLLALERLEPPSDRCRPVLRSLSSGDRRRQRELDAEGHLLSCPCCPVIRRRLLERRETATPEGEARVLVTRDADVVEARQKGREVAARAGFSTTDLTLIATAISEIARNIVKFAERGEVVITAVSAEDRRGVRVVARDVGPGITDPERALQDGYSTYHGLGLGLPGARRLMDRLELSSVVGAGTTVTMEKWLR